MTHILLSHKENGDFANGEVGIILQYRWIDAAQNIILSNVFTRHISVELDDVDGIVSHSGAQSLGTNELCAESCWVQFHKSYNHLKS